MTLTETAYAKINLALHVRGRRDDGYHLLETLFAFAEDGDVLTAEPSAHLSLTISGPFSDALAGGADNLVLQAATGLQKMLKTQQGATIHLDKRLPVAAGIGGGSADAATVLRLLPRLWGLAPDREDLQQLAASLGADVPACIASQTVRGEGVGDILTPVHASDLSGLPLLLVNPGIPCPTGPVFKAWDGVDRGPLATGSPLAAALAGRNDLQGPASAIIPEIGEICASLESRNTALISRMSGSGATCFAIFESDEALADASETMRPYWHLATRLR